MFLGQGCKKEEENESTFLRFQRICVILYLSIQSNVMKTFQ